MFIAALVQKQMQKKSKNKGLTVFICDDNQREMSNFSDGLYTADAWFDPIYQASRKKKGKTIWCEVSDHERFDQIINSAFAIKSEHSSLVQVADAVSYAYRRYLELKSYNEDWEGEQQNILLRSWVSCRKEKSSAGPQAVHALNSTRPHATANGA